MASRDFKLACSDHSFPLLPHSALVPLAANLGFEGLDLGVIGDEAQLKAADMGDAEAAEKLGAEASEAGLTVSDLLLVPSLDFSVLALNSPDGTVREESRTLFEEAVDFAERVGCVGISVLPGVAWPEESEQDSRKRAAEELSWRAATAGDRGIDLSFEANMGSIADTVETASELLEAAGPDVKLTLDYTHFVAQGVDESEVDPLLESARHLHVRGGREGRLQCAASQSTIDYARIAKLLLDMDYRGFVSSEYAWLEYEGMNDTDNLSETIMLRDLFRAAAADWSG